MLRITTIGIMMLFCLNACVNEKKETLPPSSEVNFPLERLAGSWEDISKDNAFYEEWEVLADKHLVGKGYVLSGIDSLQTDTVFIENLEIKPKGERLVYLVKLSGGGNNDEVEFTMNEVSKNSITFANPLHDFPKVITYEIVSNVEMKVFLDGKRDGPFGETRFSFIRRK